MHTDWSSLSLWFFSSSACFGLLFLIFLLTIPIDSLCSGLVSLLASQSHQHHGHLTNFWCFWQCGQVPNPAGKWNQHRCISIKVLFSDESKFCISFVNQGPRVWRKGGEAHSPSCLKSSVKFPQSVMIWGSMSSAGVGPLCFLKTNVTAPVYQETLEHFMLPSADQLFKDADFIFQQDLAPVHTAKSNKSWLNDHGVGVLDWPANSPDLNIENLCGIVKRKMRNKRPKHADELKATVKETWASYHLSSATNWSAPCHAALRH